MKKLKIPNTRFRAQRIKQKENFLNEELWGIDLIRVMAMISIAIYHYTTRYQEKFGWIECWNFNFQMGSNAVFLFFLISKWFSVNLYNEEALNKSVCV